MAAGGSDEPPAKRPKAGDEETKRQEKLAKRTAQKLRFDTHYKDNDCPADDVQTYDIEALIGQGGWGDVYRAKKGDRLYAIKDIEKRTVYRYNFSSNIIEEKKIMFAMDSDFVVKLFAKWKDAESVYLIMEYATAGDLEKLSEAYDRERVPEAILRKIMCQVALGLEYLHACSVVHRDLKPSNVLLFEGGRAKIGDMGFAIKTEDPINNFVGSPPYSAPEQLQGARYHDSVDWWAFGITLCAAALSEHPFSFWGAPQELVLESLIKHKYRKEFEDGPITAELKDLVKQLLKLNPTERLGVKAMGVDDVAKHPWFQGIDWETVERTGIVFTVETPEGLLTIDSEVDPKLNADAKGADEDVSTELDDF